MQLARGLYYLVASVVVIGIVIGYLRYLPPDLSVGFLQGKSAIFEHYRYAFYGHLIITPIVFFCGLINLIRKKRDKLHRRIGKVYVFSILFLAAPSGCYMAFYAMGHWLGHIAFLLLAVLWWLYAFLGYRSIRRGNLDKHQHFITGSYILTQAAVLLRILLYLSNQFEVLNSTQGYGLLTLLSYLPLLLFYERKRLIPSRR